MNDRRKDYSDWAGQYILAADPVVVPGWEGRRIAGRYLVSHPSLPVVPVVAKHGQEVGTILGWPVSPGGELVKCMNLNGSFDGLGSVYEHGGRWLLVMEEELYLDPSGSQPAVYAPDLGIVASSPGLIDAEDDAELVDAFDVVNRDGWYPFGLTPKRGVHRLLPNHKLDLNTFIATRHHEAPAPGSVAVEEAASVALEAIDAAGSAFADTGLFVGLTAGQDSRMLLAGLRDHLDNTQFWTARSVARTNPIDVQIARTLANRFELNHVVVAQVPTTEADIEDWLDRVGWTRAGDKAKNHKMEEATGGNRPFGHGAIGGLARGTYWREGDLADEPLTPEEAMRRISAPRASATAQAAKSWLDGLASSDRLRVLDLLLLEQRVGCWASPGNLGSSREAPTIFLLNRRDVVDAMLALSHADKRAGLYTTAVIRQGWPELLSLPFNQPMGGLAVKVRARRLADMARFQLGRLRRRLLSLGSR